MAFDLSGYAGGEVEVAISYVSDPFTGGAGVFVDQAGLTIDGIAVETEGFESDLGPGRRPVLRGQPRERRGLRGGRSPRSGPRSPPTTPCCSGSASNRCPTRRIVRSSSAQS